MSTIQQVQIHENRDLEGVANDDQGPGSFDLAGVGVVGFAGFDELVHS